MKKMMAQFILCFFLSLLKIVTCAAQGAVPANQEVGLLSYGSYHGGDIDQVDLKSGNLFARVPLFSLPQLGNLSLSLSMTLNNNGFAVADTCDTFEISVQSGDNQTDTSETDCWPYVYRQLPVGPTLTLNQDLGIYFSDTPPVYWGYASAPWISSNIVDSTGATHLMGYDVAFSEAQVQRATDGTGYTFVPNSPSQFESGMLYTPDGLIHSSANGAVIIADPALANNGMANPIKYGLGNGGSSTPFTFNTFVGDPYLGSSSPVFSNSGCAYSVELESACGDGEINFTSPGEIIDSVGRVIPDLASSPLLTDSASLASCPNLNISNQLPSGIQKWQVPGPNGQSVTYKLCYTTVTYSTNFMDGFGFEQASNASFYAEYYADAMGSGPAIQSIVLPNGTFWGFEYDSLGSPPYISGTSNLLNPCSADTSGEICQTPSPVAYGDITKIIRPTGGSTSFSFASGVLAPNECSVTTYSNEGGIFTNPNVGRIVQSRTVNDGIGGSATWGYSWSWLQPQQLIATVSDPIIPSMNPTKTVHTYQDVAPGQCSLPERMVQQFDGNSILQSVTTQYLTVANELGYNGGAAYENLPQTVQTFVGGQNGLILSDTETYSYAPLYANTIATLTNSGIPAVGTGPGISIYFSQPSAILSSGADGAVRNKLTTYEWQLAPSSAVTSFASPSVNILTAPASTCTLGIVVNNPLAGCSPVLTSVLSATQYVYGDNASPYNLGAVQKLFSGTWMQTSSMQRDSSGRVIAMFDANGNQTKFAYGSDPVFGGPSPFPNQIWDPLALAEGYSDRFTFDSINGNLVSHTDRNGQTTTYTYDSLGRVLSIAYPDHGNTTYCYSDDVYGSCSGSLPFFIHKEVAASPNPIINSNTVYDGLARPIHEYDASGAESDTVYDALGRIASRTNPYFSMTDATLGTTLFRYDALGRKIIQTEPDHSTLQWCYNGLSTAGQSNCSAKRSSVSATTWVDTTDEVGGHRQQVSDSLGNLVAVMEPTPSDRSLSVETDYQYDALGRLQRVNQQGLVGLDQARTRDFFYDSLSRLRTSYNPETGTICYGTLSSGSSPTANNCIGAYDPNGNLLHKTDARGISTTYAYDALNRMTSKTYSDGTPTANFSYDQTGNWGVAGCGASGFTQCNTVGRLSSMAAGSSSTIFTYDAMGRMIGKSSCIATICGSDRIDQFFTYDLAGNLTSYDHGTDVAQQRSYGAYSFNYDNAGRLSQMSTVQASGSSTPSVTLLGNTSYGPVGLLNSTLGNGLNEYRTYDTRARQTSYNAINPAYSTSAAMTGIIDGAYNTDIIRFPNVTVNATGIPQNGFITVTGWAGTSLGCPVSAVELDVDQTPIGYATLGVPGPDVQQIIFNNDGQHQNCRFTFTGSVGEVAVGSHTLAGYAIDSEGNRIPLNLYPGVGSITVSADAPLQGNIDGLPAASVVAGGLISLDGWSIDSEMHAPIAAVKILIDGSPIGYATLGLTRQDVANFFNDQRYLNSGWAFTGSIGNLSADQHTVSVVAYDTGGQNVALASNGAQLSALTVTADTRVDDAGSVDGAFNASDHSTIIPMNGSLVVSGWAGEQNSQSCASSISRVDVLIDGLYLGQAQLGGSRPDVSAVLNNASCTNSGWNFSGPVSNVDPGFHTIQARAYDETGGGYLLSSSSQIQVNGQISAVPPVSSLAGQYGWSLGFDPIGNVSFAADSVNGNNAYLYDNLNRLIGATWGTVNAYQWSYDSFGNRLSQTVLEGTGITHSDTFSNGNNRADNIPYDAAGNALTDMTHISQFTYDAEGRLSSSGSTSYLYDAQGQRVAKFNGGTLSNAYLYDNAGHVVTELDVNFNLVRKEVYAANRHLGTYDASGNLTYDLTDWLGTTRAVTNSSGVICQTIVSQPFGGEEQQSGSCSASPVFLTGKEHDAESGLDYFGARYYGSNMGRWMSPDPGWYIAADPSNPQTWNQYAYVINNPLTFVDPYGLDGARPAATCWLCWFGRLSGSGSGSGPAPSTGSGSDTMTGGTPSSSLGPNQRAQQQGSDGGGILGKIKNGIQHIRDGIRFYQEGRDVKLWIAAADADRKIIDNYDPITDRDTVDLTLVQARLTFEIAKTAESLINLGMDFKSQASSFGTPDTVSGELGKIAIGVANMGLNIAEAGYKASFDKSVKMAEQNYIQALEAHQ